MAVALTKDQEMAAHWKTQIEQCDKATEKWRKRAEKISKNYRDERDDQDKGAAKRLNLYWSNVQTLKPAIYSKTPVPVCERRFLDKDTTGKAASIILERTLRYEVSMSGFDATVRRARNDYLGGPGRGQVWVRYSPKFGEPISPEQKADDELSAEAGEDLKDDKREETVEAEQREFLAESLAVDYVHWQDFYIFPANARTWVEVEGVGRRLFMSRSDMEDAEFKDWKTIPLDHVPKMDGEQGGKSTVSGQQGMQATIFEIWWKPERCVYFLSKAHDKICKEVDDPLKLEAFFPCPEPLSATMTNDTMIPVPDYAESQDQYIQIDDLTKRIDILTAACKVAGVYNAANPALKRVLEEAQEPNLIPVDDWAGLKERGGLENSLELVDIEQIAKTLEVLIEVRKQIMEDLDRTTGISDIMRGTSDARETMGAQRLKTNNSSTRLQERQDDMARFCRDIICIMGEIVSEHYSPETLVQISGALHDEGLDPPALPSPPLAPPQMGHNGGPPLQSPGGMGSPPGMPPQAQPPTMSPPAGPQPLPGPGPGGMPPGMMAPPGPMVPPQETPEQKQERKMGLIADAITLLRQDKLRGFRIDIETDSTVQGDAQMEKAQRIEFVEGVTKFVQVAGEVSATMPEFVPLAAKMLGFAVRGFRTGRDVESAIDDFCDSVEKKAKERAGQPPPPNPDMVKAETDRMVAEHKIQTEGQQNSIEAMKAQAEVESQKVEAQSEAQNAAMETQRKQMEMQMQHQLKQMDIRLKEMDIHIATIKAHAEERKIGMEQETSDRESQFAREDHQRKSELADVEHKSKIAEHNGAPAVAVDHVADAIGKMSEHIKGLHDHIHAPVEFIRGPDGRTTKVRKGSVERDIARGPDGRATGLQ